MNLKWKQYENDDENENRDEKDSGYSVSTVRILLFVGLRTRKRELL